MAVSTAIRIKCEVLLNISFAPPITFRHVIVYSFILFRFIGGLGVGTSTVAAPLFISEIAPAKNRGKLAGLYQACDAIREKYGAGKALQFGKTFTLLPSDSGCGA